MKTLQLVLKTEWFDKIKSGVKTSEYREVKPYWLQRICDKIEVPIGKETNFQTIRFKVDKVEFIKGYKKGAERMLFDIKYILYLPSGIDTDLHYFGPVFEIVLGKRLK